jgi:cysteine desulfurase
MEGSLSNRRHPGADAACVYARGIMIYADYNATTPMDPRVIEVMTRSMRENFGNPSSSHHAVGQIAAESVETARRKIADGLEVRSSEVVFTSGATEAINLAVYGVLARNSLRNDSGRKRLLVSPTEHKAVLESMKLWASVFGSVVEEIPINSDGTIKSEEFKELLAEDVLLVAVALANNETGVINPIKELSELTHEKGAHFLSDTTQGLGKIPLRLSDLDVDLAVISGHKVYGPKGVGALIGRNKIHKNHPSLVCGGGLVTGLRGGSLYVAAISGFGSACEYAVAELETYSNKMQHFSDLLLAQIQKNVSHMSRNGDGAQLLPNTFNLRFDGADAEAVINAMIGVAISTGSACQSAVPSPSHVLTSMGLSHEEARECLRISLGRFSEESDIKVLVSELSRAVDYVRSFS